MSGTELILSSAYHPQTEDQIEIVNKGLEGYLRSFSRDRPSDWAQWLPLVEYTYNTSEHTSTKISPYEVAYGQPPPRMMPNKAGVAKVQAVELRSRELINKLVRENLKEAQERMKLYAERHIIDQEFQVGDKVYLRLRPYD